jgi:glycosyltransferase involved in cell wall biosynthesis
LIHVEHETFSLRSRRAQHRLRALSFLCHRIVAVGEEIRDFLVDQVHLASPRVALIRNGIDLSRYRPGHREARERFGLPTAQRWIGQIARLEEEKDQATLLRAFAVVRDRHPDARLVIVGDGSLRGALEDLARTLGVEPWVSFLGARSDVADLLPELDVFVLSSIREGLPLALLEAMACGVPVVATAIGNVPRVVRDGENGDLVAPADSRALAAAICRMLESPDRAESLGAAARAWVAAEYSLDATVRRYQELYDELSPDVEAAWIRRGV